MALSDYYPRPVDLIKSELDVLSYLRNNPYIKEKHGRFARDASTYYNQNRHGQGFSFNSFFDIWHEPIHREKGGGGVRKKPTPNVRLTISSLIKLNSGAFDNVTYCLAIFRIRFNRFIILRKFHFDVTVSSNASQLRLQEHPQCHLQYCGEMVPPMVEMGCRQTQLDQIHPWLSEPRIFFWPMSLALLLDMAFHEFPDVYSKKFRASSEWRELVRHQEALVLKPFYERCVKVIMDGRRQNRTLADEFYVG